jgi:hypothetical protein
MATNFTERNKQTISNISQLQEKEREFYSILEDRNLSEEKRKIMIDEINGLSEMRMNMYADLQNMYSSYRDNVNTLDSTIDSQFKSINKMEDELNQSKIYLNSIDQLKIDKLRVTEINNYYAKRYNAYKNIMFIIAITCIPILALTILNNNSVIPSYIYQIISSIIVLIASYFIFNQYLDISNRDSINWDNYSWYFNKSDAPEPGESTGEDVDEGDDEDEGDEDVCVGSACCAYDYVYDSTLNQCVPPEEAST